MCSKGVLWGELLLVHNWVIQAKCLVKATI